MQAFDYIDKDGDGKISMDDLKDTNKEVRLSLSGAELAGLMDEADRDGDGLISKEDFIFVMKRTNLFSQ